MEGPGTGFLPLFRSEQQHALLAQLFVAGADAMPMTMTTLAAVTGIAVSTVSREMARLAAAGIVTVEPVGRARRVAANWDSALARPLQLLLAQTAGPLVELRSLYEVRGVGQVFVFGSWAARYLGEAGPFPNDVDVAVIGIEVDRFAVQTECARVARRIKTLGGRSLDVNPTVFDAAEWRARRSGSFAATVRKGPLVEVRPSAADVTVAS